jgi:inhibitor of cysteine peptidase
MAAITLTRAEHGKSIEAHVGDVITVTLDENPTTGFRWAIDKSDDVDVVALSSSEYAAAPRSRVGKGGRRVVTFEVRKTGTSTIQLKLWREWEGDQSVTQRFAVKLLVR